MLDFSSNGCNQIPTINHHPNANNSPPLNSCRPSSTAVIFDSTRERQNSSEIISNQPRSSSAVDNLGIQQLPL